MTESFEVKSLTERSNEGTITPEGEAWLAGYNGGQEHANYVEAYGGDLNKEEPTPENAGRWADSEHFTYFAAGWTEGIEHWENEQYEEHFHE